MELLVCGGVIVLVIAIVGWLMDEQKKEKEKAREAEEEARLAEERQTQLSDPRWVGAELTRLVGDGDAHSMQPLVETLPAWPVRAALLNAAQRLAVLSRGVGMAEPAGVPAAMVQELYASIEGAKGVLNSVAVKVVSLVNQSGDHWKGLPDEARRWLDSDARTLHMIDSAAAALHQSLAVAIAAGERHGDQRGQQSGHTLHALTEAIRDLSQPAR
jgi:hypothetical protein